MEYVLIANKPQTATLTLKTHSNENPSCVYIYTQQHTMSSCQLLCLHWILYSTAHQTLQNESTHLLRLLTTFAVCACMRASMSARVYIR